MNVSRPAIACVAGAGRSALCMGVSVAGHGRFHFTSALVLLGLGWNFLFVGATTLLTGTYRGAEMAKAQGLNDFLVFGTVALTATSSGALHHALGWQVLNLSVVPFVVLAATATVWLRARGARVHDTLDFRETVLSGEINPATDNPPIISVDGERRGGNDEKTDRS